MLGLASAFFGVIPYFFSGVIYHGVSMKGSGVMGLVLGLSGVVAFARLQKLTKDLKARSVLDAYFKEE